MAEVKRAAASSTSASRGCSCAAASARSPRRWRRAYQAGVATGVAVGGALGALHALVVVRGSSTIVSGPRGQPRGPGRHTLRAARSTTRLSTAAPPVEGASARPQHHRRERRKPGLRTMLDPLTLATAALVAGAMPMAMTRTPLGLRVRERKDPAATTAAGVDVARVRLLANVYLRSAARSPASTSASASRVRRRPAVLIRHGRRRPLHARSPPSSPAAAFGEEQSSGRCVPRVRRARALAEISSRKTAPAPRPGTSCRCCRTSRRSWRSARSPAGAARATSWDERPRAWARHSSDRQDSEAPQPGGRSSAHGIAASRLLRDARPARARRPAVDRRSARRWGAPRATGPRGRSPPAARSG